MICLTAKLNKDIDLELGNTAQRGMVLPCFPWHGFAFGLGWCISLSLSLCLSHTRTHSFLQERNTGSQRCLEIRTHKYTHTNTHSRQHWFPVWHYLAVNDTAEGRGLFSRPQCRQRLYAFCPSWHFTDKSARKGLCWSLAPSLLL